MTRTSPAGFHLGILRFVRSVTKRRIYRSFATTKRNLAVTWCDILHRRQFGSLVRAVAKRLIGAASTGAPPILFSLIDQPCVVKRHASPFPSPIAAVIPDLYQGSVILTHRDRAWDPSGRRKTAGDAAHRRGVSTPSEGSHARPDRRLSWTFGRRRARLAMHGIAAPSAPGRKSRKGVSMSQYH